MRVSITDLSTRRISTSTALAPAPNFSGVSVSNRQPDVARRALPSLRDRWAQRDYGGITPDLVTSVMLNAKRGYLEFWADLCGFMLRTDPWLRACYMTRRVAVASLPTVVRPGRENPTPNDELGRALCEYALHQLKDTERVNLDLLDGIGRGWAVSELIWDYVETPYGWAWLPVDIVWLHARRFRYDEQWRLTFWDGGSFTETLSMSEQERRDIPASAYAWGLPLPPRKFVVHVPRNIAEYPTVSGELMPVVWPWLFKRWAIKFNQEGAERYADPILLALVPREMVAQKRENFRQDLELMSANGVIVAENTNALTQLHPGSAPQDIWDKLIMRHNQEITVGVLGSADNVQSDAGSNARAQSQDKVTIAPRVQSDAKALSGTWERDVFEPIIHFNRHIVGDSTVPEHQFVVEDDASASQIIGPQHMSAGIVTKNEVRKQLGLPPLPAAQGGDELLVASPATGVPGGSGIDAGAGVLDVPLPPSERSGVADGVGDGPQRTSQPGGADAGSPFDGVLVADWSAMLEGATPDRTKLAEITVGRPSAVIGTITVAAEPALAAMRVYLAAEIRSRGGPVSPRGDKPLPGVNKFETAMREALLRAHMMGQSFVRLVEVPESTPAAEVKHANEPGLTLATAPLQEAVDAFMSRRLMTPAEFAALDAAAKTRAFTVSRLADEAMRAKVNAALARAILQGTTLNDFVAELESGGIQLERAYAETVFRTNVLGAYGAGRFRQITDPAVVETGRLVEYRTVNDDRVRPTHAVLHLMVWEIGDSSWHNVAPPGGYACRCAIVTIPRDRLGFRDIRTGVPADGQPDPGFDSPPYIENA